jgi:hypothetical protein
VATENDDRKKKFFEVKHRAEQFAGKEVRSITVAGARTDWRTGHSNADHQNAMNNLGERLGLVSPAPHARDRHTFLSARQVFGSDPAATLCNPGIQTHLAGLEAWLGAMNPSVPSP